MGTQAMEKANQSAEHKGLLTKKDLNSMFWRINTVNFSFTMERMQAFGYYYTMIPALKKIYKDRPKEERTSAIKRHLEFFNSQINASSVIFGVTAALEESTAEDEKESVTSVKASLMGPFAGLGDGLLKFTWLPICASIGAALALSGNVLLGPILMFLLFNLVNIPTKYLGIHYGYAKGVDLFTGEAGKRIIARVTNLANVLGLVVIGGMVASSVRLSTPLAPNIGESALEIQPLLDKIIPCLLPVLLVGFCYWFMKKTKRKYLLALVFGLLIVLTVLAKLGIF